MLKLLLLLTLLASTALHAGAVNRADLQSPDELTRLRTLWAIAQAGKTCGVAEADLLPLLTQTWEGRRQAKWCYYALGKLGAPHAKHYAAFSAAATWTEPRPNLVDDRKRTEPEWRKKLEGPELPEDLQKALPVVWNYALDGAFEGFSDVKKLSATHDHLTDFGAPKKILAPRLAALISDPKSSSKQRYTAIYTLQILRRCEGVTEALAQALAKDPDPHTRQAAASAISAMTMDVTSYGDPTWIYNHPDRDAALAALLKAMQTDSDKNVRSAATSGLRYMESEARPVVPQVLELIKTNKDLRADLLYIVATWEVKEGVPLAIDALQDLDPAVQVGALMALEKNARSVKYNKLNWDLSPAVPAIEKLLRKTQDAKVKKNAEEALKSLNDIPPGPPKT